MNKGNKMNLLSCCLPLVLAASFLTGCSGMKQNPLEGMGEAIENAKPPLTKPEIQKPVGSDAVRIDGPDVFSFRENEAQKIVFSVRALVANYTGSVSIANMAEFSGATFNARTGEFAWTPTLGTVVSGYVNEKILIIEGIASTNKATDPILITRKEVRLIVQKLTRNPIIKSVLVRDPLMRENGVFYISVVVQDPEGTNVDVEKPRLLLSSGGVFTSLAPFITEYSNAGNLTSKEWTIELKVNLQGAEVTDSVLSSTFDIQALNRYGLFSVPLRVTTNVATDLNEIDTTIDALNEVTVGQNNVVPFTIFDVKSEAVIGIKTIRGLPGTSEIKCAASTRKSAQKCNFIWFPDQKELMKVYTVSVDVEMKNKNASDTKSVIRTFSFQVTTVEGEVAPLPSPFGGVK